MFDSSGGRLVSLLAMLTFKAAPFIGLMDLLRESDTMLRDDDSFLGHPSALSDAVVSSVSNILNKMREYCAPLGLRTSTGKINAVLIDISIGFEPERIKTQLRELHEIITLEIGGKQLFSLTGREADFYIRSTGGWDQVIARFPEALRDIEESAKCFALSRYAAAVFHSTQVVEFGLLELGVFIGVKDPHSGWTAVARDLKRIIDKPYPTRSDFENQNYAFLEQVQGTVEAMKNAWRNKISHAQGQLKLLTADFVPDIAEEILMASRAFMRRLADGLPPSPQNEHGTE
jgi:hypothetical protein